MGAERAEGDRPGRENKPLRLQPSPWLPLVSPDPCMELAPGREPHPFQGTPSLPELHYTSATCSYYFSHVNEISGIINNV